MSVEVGRHVTDHVMDQVVTDHDDRATLTKSLAEVILYGASWCVWSKRMHAELKRHGKIPFRVVWCDLCSPDKTTSCSPCVDVKAYPVLAFPDGSQWVGFHHAALVREQLQKMPRLNKKGPAPPPTL